MRTQERAEGLDATSGAQFTALLAALTLINSGFRYARAVDALFLLSQSH